MAILNGVRNVEEEARENTFKDFWSVVFMLKQPYFAKFVIGLSHQANTSIGKKP